MKDRLIEAAPKVVALIPAYNEEKKIVDVVTEASEYVDEIIVCDDGSTDLTGDLAWEHGARVIRHEKNRGYGAALQTLFREAITSGADIAVTLDSDGQHNPKELSTLVNHLQLNDLDIVIGSRFISGDDGATPGWRAGGIKVINRLVSQNGEKLTDTQSGFRAYSRKALETLTVTENGMGASTEILIKARNHDLKIGETPITITYHEESSTINPAIHGFSVLLSTIKYLSINRPLMFYGVPGILSLCLSLFFWAWTFSIYSSSRIVVTNIALIAIGTTIVGLILMTTAIMLWVITSLINENIRSAR